jgi:hypothetical protein
MFDDGPDSLDIVDEVLQRHVAAEIVRGNLGRLEGLLEAPESAFERLLGMVDMLEEITPAGRMGDFPEDAAEFPDEVVRGNPLHRYLRLRHLPGKRLGLSGTPTERTGPD